MAVMGWPGERLEAATKTHLTACTVCPTHRAVAFYRGTAVVRALLQRDPEVCFWAQCFFGGLGYKGQKTTLFLKMCGSLALVPQASKKPLGKQKHYGTPLITSCYAIVLPGRKSAFRAGFWPDRHRPSEADFDASPVAVLPKSGPKAVLRPGSTMA